MSKILVIDDERAIRNTLKEVLEYEKHEVDLAEDGPSGLELFGSKHTTLFSAISNGQDGRIEVSQTFMRVSDTPLL
jgi:CheY-like chemotaxis protein